MIHIVKRCSLRNNDITFILVSLFDCQLMHLQVQKKTIFLLASYLTSRRRVIKDFYENKNTSTDVFCLNSAFLHCLGLYLFIAGLMPFISYPLIHFIHYFSCSFVHFMFLSKSVLFVNVTLLLLSCAQSAIMQNRRQTFIGPPCIKFELMKNTRETRDGP